MCEIQGVSVRPLRTIPDSRGAILHMCKESDSEFSRFGEIYFSTVFYGQIKAWKRQEKASHLFAVIYGSIKLALFDDRPGSPTRGNVQEIVTGRDCYLLIKVPPLIWNGFIGLHEPESIIANVSSESHTPEHIQRQVPNSPAIPYSWTMQ